MTSEPASVSPWRWACRAVLVLYVSALVTGTHLPDENLAVQSAVHMTADNDHLTHFLAYFGFAVLLFGLCRVGSTWPALLAGLAFVILFGAADELTQPWFQRSAEWYDWFGDTLGACLGCVAGRLGVWWWDGSPATAGRPAGQPNPVSATSR